MTDPESTDPGVEVYWRPGCPYCRMLMGNLRRTQLRLREVNIWVDPYAAARVRSVADGNETASGRHRRLCDGESLCATRVCRGPRRIGVGAGVGAVVTLTSDTRLPRRLRAVLITVFVVLAGCGQPSPNDPAATTAGLAPPAEPHAAPEQTAPIRGRTVPVGDAPEGVAVDAVTRTVAVAKRNPNELVLLNAETGAVTGRTPLPGLARHLQLAAPGGPVLVPVESANALLRVEVPSGRAEAPITTGTGPHDATQAQNGTVFVSNEFGGSVAALRGNTIAKEFSGSLQPGGLAAAGDIVAMIDVRKNDLTVYDAAALTVIGSVAAGAGPTHVAADRHGGMMVADTRGDAVRVFTPLPTPREVASVTQPGGPYGIAYDPVRNRLWVASSGTNEVVGYDMTGATPREVQRLPTVQNPNTLGVDTNTGRLFIAGVSHGVVQIVDPAA